MRHEIEVRMRGGWRTGGQHCVLRLQTHSSRSGSTFCGRRGGGGTGYIDKVIKNEEEEEEEDEEERALYGYEKDDEERANKKVQEQH